EDCQFLVGFTKEQQQICGRSLELMNYVLEGVVESIQACRAEFEGERWNCSGGLESVNSGGRVVEAGTRETAFLYAILSAGVTHKVTKACSSGRLKNCGCDRTLTGQEEWSGCSDNVAYGKAFARSLIDVREELVGMSHPSRALLNLHNNNAGRKTVELSMRTHCRCHGVSGACEMKTCWKTLPPFDDVSKRLKINYDNSKMVKLKKAGSQMDFAPQQQQPHSFNETDLLFTHASPSYCDLDLSRGSLGTSGRLCSNDKTATTDSCKVLCCGRGYVVVGEVTLVEKCHCKFHWCCRVECQECKRRVELYRCK
ncbi:hypothetical protein HELRODRAFT_90604, partial [Helobdella robusta]|uniref:Protein Wnt n=1 Tax=Helobdella robusta TaxID=6412 RepID=T1G7T4_HELRO